MSLASLNLFLSNFAAMNRYVDGFVIPVPKSRIEDYRKMSQAAGEVWKDYGALDYCECVGDAMETEGQIPFTQLAGAKEDETVIFAWIVYESKEARDAMLPKIMEDPRLAAMMDPNDPVFDVKRMAYGGFREIVHVTG